MRVKKRASGIIGFLLILFLALGALELALYQKEKERYSGIPDLVSSLSIGNEYYLIVVANCWNIGDKEDFAKDVIERCRNNSFKSIMFSTDLNGYPARLDIDVYLTEQDIGKTEPVLQVRFQPDKWNAEYNIRDDVEHYLMYVDGKQITYSKGEI